MTNSCTSFYKYQESNYKKQKEKKHRSNIFKENDPLLMKGQLQDIIGKQADTDYELEEEQDKQRQIQANIIAFKKQIHLTRKKHLAMLSYVKDHHKKFHNIRNDFLQTDRNLRQSS